MEIFVMRKYRSLNSDSAQTRKGYANIYQITFFDNVLEFCQGVLESWEKVKLVLVLLSWKEKMEMAIY